MLNSRSSAWHWIAICRPRASDAFNALHSQEGPAVQRYVAITGAEPTVDLCQDPDLLNGFIEDRLGSSITDGNGPHGDKGSDARKIVRDSMRKFTKED